MGSTLELITGLKLPRFLPGMCPCPHSTQRSHWHGFMDTQVSALSCFSPLVPLAAKALLALFTQGNTAPFPLGLGGEGKDWIAISGPRLSCYFLPSPPWPCSCCHPSACPHSQVTVPDRTSVCFTNTRHDKSDADTAQVTQKTRWAGWCCGSLCSGPLPSQVRMQLTFIPWQSSKCCLHEM